MDAVDSAALMQTNLLYAVDSSAYSNAIFTYAVDSTAYVELALLYAAESTASCKMVYNNAAETTAFATVQLNQLHPCPIFYHESCHSLCYSEYDICIYKWRILRKYCPKGTKIANMEMYSLALPEY